MPTKLVPESALEPAILRDPYAINWSDGQGLLSENLATGQLGNQLVTTGLLPALISSPTVITPAIFEKT